MPHSDHPSPSLRDLTTLFLRLGATAFGGPAAHIGLIEHEVVHRRQWLNSTAFLDLLGAAMLLPGPTSTELAMYVGYRLRRWPGLIAAGTAFIAPAAVLVVAFAWLYVHGRAIPSLVPILGGIEAVVIGIIAHAIWLLARTAVKNRMTAIAGAAALVASLLGVSPFAILIGSAVVAIAAYASHEGQAAPLRALTPAVPVPGMTMMAGTVTTLGIGLVFLKIGVVVFGSGYVLLAFLRAELVTRLGWITERQLLDAVAAGQMTPGPLFTTATFLGYLLRGWTGAAIATGAVFLPAFLLVGASGSILPRLRQSPAASLILDVLSVVSLALMIAATAQLARSAIVDGVTAALAVLTLSILIRYRLSSLWLIAAGASIGWIRG